jgi:hypothetical protein
VAASPAPTLRVDPARVALFATEGMPPAFGGTLRIADGGSGPIAWTASSSVPWLAVSPPSGLTPGVTNAVLDVRFHPVGTYTGQITVAGAGAPVVIPVELQVTPAPFQGGGRGGLVILSP